MVVVTSFFAVIAPETDPGFGYVRGRVKDVGKSYYGYTRYVLEDVTFNGVKAGGNLYLKSASELETGDIVEFAAVTEAVNPDPFDSYSSIYYETKISTAKRWRIYARRDSATFCRYRDCTSDFCAR